MKDYYRELLRRYLAGKATFEELGELERMYTEEEFEKELDPKMYAELKKGGPYHDPGVTPEIMERAEVIKNHIRTKAEVLLKNMPDDTEVELPPLARGKGRNLYFAWMAAAAVVIIATGLWFFNLGTHNLAPVSEVSEQTAHRGKQFIRLPDGSTVLLNEGSELTYQNFFGQQAREVSLTGEAYFDVQHNPARPFIVHTGSVKTTVLGTAFNINTFHNNVTVTVTRGKVKVDNETKTPQYTGEEAVYVTANEQVSVDTRTHQVEKVSLAETETAQKVHWKNTMFVLNRVTMQEAAELIAERFGIEVIITNPKLKTCEIVGAFVNNESAEMVAAWISRTVSATYTLENGVITIQGGVECE